MPIKFAFVEKTMIHPNVDHFYYIRFQGGENKFKICEARHNWKGSSLGVLDKNLSTLGQLLF